MTVYGGPWVVSYPVYDPSLWRTRKTFEKLVGREFAKTEVWKLTAGQPGCACAQTALAAVRRRRRLRCLHIDWQTSWS